MKITVVVMYLGMVVLFQGITMSATVTGFVKSQGTGKPVKSASVVITNHDGYVKGTTVIGEGLYIINDVKIGTYIIATGAAGFVTRTDTLVIRRAQTTYDVDIVLSEALVESNPITEDYHRQLRDMNAQYPIITMKIEHYMVRHGIMVIYPSVQNNTKFSFHIIRPLPCVNYFSAIVRDYYGKEVYTNYIRTDCVGEKLYPTREDRIQIPEQQTVDCPPVKLEFYNFNMLPKGTYTIRLKYHFEKSTLLAGLDCNPDYRKRYEDLISTLITTLRGEYESINIITYENNH